MFHKVSSVSYYQDIHDRHRLNGEVRSMFGFRLCTFQELPFRTPWWPDGQGWGNERLTFYILLPVIEPTGGLKFNFWKLFNPKSENPTTYRYFINSPVVHLIENYRVVHFYEMFQKSFHFHRQIFQCNELTDGLLAVPYFGLHKCLWNGIFVKKQNCICLELKKYLEGRCQSRPKGK